MKTLTIKEVELPMNDFPTMEAMADAVRHWQESIERSQEGTKYRMENYYNCVDDYSWGGPCDRAADWNISRCNSFIALMKEQMEKPEPQTWDFHREVLADLDGNIVSERIIKTKYGFAWIIGEGENVEFVGCVKRQSTYETKGYRVMTITETAKFYYLPRESKQGLMAQSIITSRTIAPATDERVANPHERKSNQIYFALNETTR